jgi:hypothetical protein
MDRRGDPNGEKHSPDSGQRVDRIHGRATEGRRAPSSPYPGILLLRVVHVPPMTPGGPT